MNSLPNSTENYRFDTFLSYSRIDLEVAGRIREALEKKGVRVWQDTRVERLGDVWIGTIEKGLEESRTAIVLASPASMASRWVMEEYRAALAIDRQVIPVLLEEAKLPPFLASRQWVDMRNPGEQDERIAELIEAIQGNGSQVRPVPTSAQEDKALSDMRWLWFFPEGLPSFVYNCMASSLIADRQSYPVSNLVFETTENGAQLIGLDPERYRDLVRHISNQGSLAKDVVACLLRCFANDDPFLSVSPISIVQLRLLRDLLRLFRQLAEDERDDLPVDYYFDLSRRVLRAWLTPEQALPALEISREIEGLGEFSPRDALTRARLLATLGLNLQAAELFQAYLGDNIFSDWNLSTAERVAAVLDWAKAEKDAKRGRKNHAQILDAYSQALALSGIEAEDRALLLNNRSTHIAIFGSASDWPSARADIEESAEIFHQLGDLESYLHTRANFVALSLEQAPTAIPILDLIKFMDATQTLKEPSKALFFFFYQKARLAKRTLPPRWQLAREGYQNAADVAEAVGLTARSVIAKRWVSYIDYHTGAAQLGAYLNKLEEYRNILAKSIEDAWSANALRDLCFDLCQLHVKGGNQVAAWEAGSQAFKLEAQKFRRFAAPGTTLRLLAVVRCLADSVPTTSQGAEFVRENRDVMAKLMDLPSWKQFSWNDVLSWIPKQQEVLNGHPV